MQFHKLTYFRFLCKTACVATTLSTHKITAATLVVFSHLSATLVKLPMYAANCLK